MFDTIIIGAGPAGLTAAIYAARRQLKTLIIAKQVGGQVIWASTIENFPGFAAIKSFDLVNKMQNQVKNLGIDIKVAQVKKITKNKNYFILLTEKEQFQTKTIIIAMGLEPRYLNLPNEKELIGKGIGFCANCDGPLYKDKLVAVIGGGNAALDAAELMSKIARKVYLIHKLDYFEAFEILVEKVRGIKNIQILLDTEVRETVGANKLESIRILNNKTGETSQLDISGMFIEIGREAQTDLVANLVKRDEKNQIIVDQGNQTSLAGVFAAGDVTQLEFKQIIIGCGQGAIAALSAYKYLQTNKNFN